MFDKAMQKFGRGDLCGMDIYLQILPEELVYFLHFFLSEVVTFS